MDTSANPVLLILGAVTLVGVLYFVYTFVFGGELGDASADIGGADDANFWFTVISAFMAGFGAVGLLGVLSGWGIPVTLGVAAVVGLALGRGVLAVLASMDRKRE